MATIPSEIDKMKAQAQTDAAISEKLADQQAQGKDFVLPKGGGPGVIPEDVWQSHKEQSNE